MIGNTAEDWSYCSSRSDSDMLRVWFSCSPLVPSECGVKMVVYPEPDESIPHLQFYFIKIHFNIFLPSKTRSPKWLNRNDEACTDGAVNLVACCKLI
jgi:hypothetical protein